MSLVSHRRDLDTKSRSYYFCSLFTYIYFTGKAWHTSSLSKASLQGHQLQLDACNLEKHGTIQCPLCFHRYSVSLAPSFLTTDFLSCFWRWDLFSPLTHTSRVSLSTLVSHESFFFFPLYMIPSFFPGNIDVFLSRTFFFPLHFLNTLKTDLRWHTYSMVLDDRTHWRAILLS